MFIVLMSEVGMISPPMGLSLLVVLGARGGGGPRSQMVHGGLPFALGTLALTMHPISGPGLVPGLPRQI